MSFVVVVVLPHSQLRNSPNFPGELPCSPGIITLLAGLLKPLLIPAVVSQMSATGGVLIVGLGLNMIRKKNAV
jgi:hypothetical protein